MSKSVQDRGLTRRYDGWAEDGGETVLNRAGDYVAAVDDGVVVEEDDLGLGDSTLGVRANCVGRAGGLFLLWLGLGGRVSDRAGSGSRGGECCVIAVCPSGLVD